MNAKAEKTKALIEQLLRKAESTTPEEAEALTEHAERLMLKYGIEQAMLNVSGEVRDEVVREAVFVTGIYAMQLFEQSMFVLRALGLQAFFIDHRRWGKFNHLSGKTEKGVVIDIVGFKSDIDTYVPLIKSLHVQSMVAMKKWNRERTKAYFETGMDAYVARRSFVAAFGLGAASRIEKNRRTIVEENGPGTELVLVDRAEKVVNWVADNMNIRVVNSQARASRDGHTAGFVAGTEATGYESEITMGRAIER